MPDQTYEYDAAIAVTPDGDGRYVADMEPGWVVGGGVNGGYALAVVGNAIRSRLGQHPDPYTASAYYLSATQPGPATVRIQDLRRGRGTSTVRATLSQTVEGRNIDRVAVLATYGDLTRGSGDVRTRAVPPDLPPVEQCRLTADASAEVKAFVPMLDRFAMCLDPSCAASFAGGEPSGRAVVQGWFEFADRRPVDPIALLTVVDTLPPVTFELGLPGWAPTLELTVHVRAVPAPGMLRVRHESRNVAGGFFEEDCEVWDSADRLVAQSRQLALLPLRPPNGPGDHRTQGATSVIG